MMLVIAYLTVALVFYVYLEIEEFLDSIDGPENTSYRSVKIAMALIWPGVVMLLAAMWLAKKLGFK